MVCAGEDEQAKVMIGLCPSTVSMHVTLHRSILDQREYLLYVFDIIIHF